MRRELWQRLGFGALCGTAGMAPLAILFPYKADSSLTALCGGSLQLAEFVRLGAGALWGAAVCAGALLWRRERGNFFTHSLWNYLLDCAAFVLWGWCCMGFSLYGPTVMFLWGVFTVLYAIGWVVRWLTCRDDVNAIRKKLGLGSPAPSPLKWRESLPYLVLTAALFLCMRPLTAPVAASPDVPLFQALILPFLAWPFIAAVSGFGAGLRYGFCPLLPLTAGLAFLPNLLWETASYSWVQALLYAAAALLGELAGILRREWKRKGDMS